MGASRVRILAAIVSLLGIDGFVRIAEAATITWTGAGGDNSWHTASNWDLNRVPGAGDDVAIPDLPATPSVTFSSGSTTITSLLSGEVLNVQSGTLAIDGAGSVTNTLNLAGATLTGVGNVVMSAAFNWTAGTLAGTGTTTLASTAVTTLSSNISNKGLSGRTLINDGLFTCTPTSGSVIMSANAVIRNRAGGVIDLQGMAGNGSLSGGTAGLVENQAGAFIKATGGTSIIEVVFTNFGTVDVLAGTLKINGPGSSSGIMNVASGTTLQFGNNYTHAAGGSVANSGSLVVAGGVLVFDPASTLSPCNALTVTSFGTATVGTNATVNTVSIGNFGVLNGSGNMTVVNAFDWADATLAGTGTTTLASTAVTTLSSNISNKGLSGRTLINDGLFTCTPTSGSVILSANAVIRNRAGGVIDLQGMAGNGSLSGGTAGTVVNQAGALIKATGGTSIIEVIFTNFGTVDVLAGTLKINGPGSSSGIMNVASGTTLQFGNNYTHAAGGSVANSGSLVVAGGVLVFDPASTLSPCNALTVTSFGTATVGTNATVNTVSIGNFGVLNGSGNMTVVNAFDWADATLAGTGTTTLASTAVTTLSSNISNKGLSGRTLINDGLFTCAPTSGSVILSANAVIRNRAGGVIDLQGMAGNGSLSGGTAGTVENQAGAFIKATGGTSIIEVIFTNFGTVDVLAGTLKINGVFSNFTGSTLTGGIYNVTSTFAFSNANIRTNSASITLDGPASQILNTQTSANALANLETNSAAGFFRLKNGRSLSTGSIFTNQGAVAIGPGGGTFTANAGYSQTAGSTVLEGGTLGSTTLVNIQEGSLAGSGTVDGSLRNDGVLAPGASPGAITVADDFTQTSGGGLLVELAGETPGTQHDALAVSGTASLAGDLNVALIDGFVPSAGASFDILTASSVTGVFSTDNLPLAYDSSCLNVNYFPSVVRINQYDGVAIIQQPASTMACIADTVMLSVATSGPALSYQWRKNQVDLSGATDSTLTLNFVSFADSGLYDVLIGSNCGPVVSGPAAVLVQSCPDTIYVNAAVPPGGSGDDWGTAMNSLEAALTKAAFPGDYRDIWVAAGTYKPGPFDVTFHLATKVALYGGFQGTETTREQRAPALYVTTLSGDVLSNDSPGFINYEDNLARIVTAANTDSTAILDGVEIRGGNGEAGSGLWIRDASPRIENSTFRLNKATRGGAVTTSRVSRPLFRACAFRDNRALVGGALATEPQQENRPVAITLIGCAFSGNRAEGGAGGAIELFQGRAMVDSCTFYANAAADSGDDIFAIGGAIAFQSDSLSTIANSTFTSNRAVSDQAFGGAVFAEHTPVLITNSTFDGNRVEHSPAYLSGGGALYLFGFEEGFSTIQNCTFANNVVLGGGYPNPSIGGAVWAHRIRPFIRECRFLGNTAGTRSMLPDGVGGALHLQENFVGIVTNCIFSGNSASEAGAVWAGETPSGGGFDFIGCSVSANTSYPSYTAGLELYCNNGLVRVANSIFWGNARGTFDDEMAQIDRGLVCGSLEVEYCDIQGLTGGLGGEGNRDVDPLFMDANGPDDSTGTADDDLLLRSFSPCIDAGSNFIVPPGILIDIVGNPRFHDDPCVANTGEGTIIEITDIGAYEFPGNSCLTGVSDPNAPEEPSSIGALRIGEPSPNPTSGVMEFVLRLPQAGRVLADVIDVSGRRAGTIFDATLPSGDHRLRWNGENDEGRSVGAGVYFLRVSTPSGSAIRRMTIIR